jgi:hypothetical protein
MDGQKAHRCVGYIRQEITPATTTADSAVVSHDSPSPLEVCSVCHEVVGLHDVFRCICCDPSRSSFTMITLPLILVTIAGPGSRATVKCQTHESWSHSVCLVNPTELTCILCERDAAMAEREAAKLEWFQATLERASKAAWRKENQVARSGMGG